MCWCVVNEQYFESAVLLFTYGVNEQQFIHSTLLCTYPLQCTVLNLSTFRGSMRTDVLAALAWVPASPTRVCGHPSALGHSTLGQVRMFASPLQPPSTDILLKAAAEQAAAEKAAAEKAMADRPPSAPTFGLDKGASAALAGQLSGIFEWGPDKGVPEAELRAIFFQYDDGDGKLTKDELADAVLRCGYTIPKPMFDEIFSTVDEDNNGTLDFDEFCVFINKTNLKPQQSVIDAMDLFRTYDADNSGSVDKFEFAQFAANRDLLARRRTVLFVALSTIAAFGVSRYDDEYAWAQKTFRGIYVDPKAEAAQNKYFPTALLSSDLDAKVASTLYRRGFTPANTLFAHSVCSDEVNQNAEELVNLMVSRWQEGFSLGGLGGLPFAGKSGFRAFLHHVPDNGKLLIFFAPHVGIDAYGVIGALEREGQSQVSKACGAAVGSYKAIKDEAEKAVKNPQLLPALPMTVLDTQDDYEDRNLPFDPELGIIIDRLKPLIPGIEKAGDPITYVTYQMYTIVRDLLDDCIKETSDVWDWATEVAIVGGIMINRRTGGDFFQPLSFELRTNEKPPSDLFAETFGAKPDLVPILGSQDVAKRVLDRSNPDARKAKVLLKKLEEARLKGFGS